MRVNTKLKSGVIFQKEASSGEAEELEGKVAEPDYETVQQEQ
jgi:hypothetical protein